ncbi:glycosyltransferase family 2 protein [Sphingomonas sp.]|uniref:glycosyltransferase family 2 protein n=1 Tax=Sphingomonas sp. TaxID=28214 RepID=UPI003CC578D5
MTLPDGAGARPEVSVVIPCYNEEENVREIHAAVQRELLAHARSHEIIFIDNGSTDRTRALMRDIAAGDPQTRLIFNTRNYGQMRSPTYGLYQAEGEAVIGMGADFQDPPALIPDVIRLWRGGAQVVFGQRRSEQASWLLTLARRSGYRFLGRYADYRVISGVTGWGLFSREVIDTLAAWNEPEPFFRGMVVEGGFRVALIPFDRPQRVAGETKNNMSALFDFALSGLAGSAKGLLRLPILLSFYIVAAVLLLGLGTLISAILGWSHTGLLLLLSVQGGIFAVLMLFLGLIGEQVRAISERTRNVPLVLEEERINFPPDRQQPAERTYIQPVRPAGRT